MQSALGTFVYHPCCAQSKCDATWGYYCTGQLSVHILWLWWHDQQLGLRQNCHLWETPAKMHKILSIPRKTRDKVPRGKEEGTRGIETLLVFKLGGWSTCQPEHCHGENKSLPYWSYQKCLRPASPADPWVHILLIQLATKEKKEEEHSNDTVNVTAKLL